MSATASFSPFHTGTLLPEAFERELEDAIATHLATACESPVAEHVRWHFGFHGDGVARRGKRLRPRLLLHVATHEGATFDEAIDAALAVECVHNSSLLHDDIEDGDDVRHGRTAVWARYGLPHGINAGDAAGALAYLALLRNRGGLSLDRVTAMQRALHGAHFAMSVGQSYDIAFESAPHVTMAAYIAMIEGKTAALFGAACELGALCAGCDEGRAAAYREFGCAYGRAFQIRDDALGAPRLSGGAERVRATDLARRKWCYPIVWALNGPPSPARDAIAVRYAFGRRLDRNDVRLIAQALETLGAADAALAACRATLIEAEQIAQRHQIDRDRTVRALFEYASGARAAEAAS